MAHQASEPSLSQGKVGYHLKARASTGDNTEGMECRYFILVLAVKARQAWNSLRKCSWWKKIIRHVMGENITLQALNWGSFKNVKLQ